MIKKHGQKHHNTHSWKDYTPRNMKESDLVKAFSLLDSEDMAGRFLRDIMTEAEIEEFANRLEIARLLKKGISYQKVSEEVDTSTTTVTRVSQWLHRGCGGYDYVLNKIDSEDDE